MKLAWLTLRIDPHPVHRTCPFPFSSPRHFPSSSLPDPVGHTPKIDLELMHEASGQRQGGYGPPPLR
jgi:hypothetical protein